MNGFVVDTGTLSGNRFWDDPEIVYVLPGDIIVPAGATPTVAPGQIVTLRRRY